MKEIVAALPWIGLAVGLLGFLLRSLKGEGAPPTPPRESLAPLLLTLLALAGSFFVFGATRTALFYVAAGSAIGVAVSFASALVRQSETGARATALGLTAFLVGTAVPSVRLGETSAFAGLVVGLAAGSLASLGREELTSRLLALGAFVGGLAAMLGHLNTRRIVGDQTAELAAWCALLAVAVAWAVGRALAGKRAWIGPACGFVVLAGLGWLSFDTYLGSRPLAVLALVSVVASLATAWASSPDRPSALAWGVASLVWLGVATFAFSQAQGLGIAVSALVALASFLLLGRRDLLTVVGLVAGLAFYRLFRQGNPLIVEPFDIGQHYSLLGFVLGVVTVVGLVDAAARFDRLRTLCTLASVLIVVAVVLGATAFFGNKGAIGLIVGLAVAPLIVGMSKRSAGWSVLAAAGLQSVALIAYGPLVRERTFEHEQKIKLLIVVALVCLALAGAVVFMSRERKVESRVEA